ncbi:M10 family metallopeptidase C-terminal domain-containing protein [Pseudomonas japonica]|uniref:M10 family metallopeptidase C-terminal domain-containing protein n=1 Tax=Pseudomonas japonica TaxID=256466 RepID=UPI0015E37344|nr:M10 family metallopeptidase C-terminal domain-containing protein [Pseudomonas japonica]MBA1287465.1 calcium-binding protein [Pseudomonas japonica]
MTTTSSDGVRVIRSATGNTQIDIANENDPGRTVAVQADGKIWVAGFTHNFGEFYQYAVTRLNPNGTLDTTFGDDGKQVIAEQIMLGDEYSMAVQNNGKLLVTHVTADGMDLGLEVTRYNNDGTLDTSFGSNGAAQVSGEVSYTDTGTTVLSDGKILISGRDGGTYTVARLNADGTPDTTFHGTGVLEFTGPTSTTGSFDFPMNVQADGKILVPGMDNDKFGLYRYNPDGSLDTTFGSNGHVSYSVGSGIDWAYTVTVQPDGKLLLAGSSDTGDFNRDFSVVRLNANGSLDTTFSSDGKAAFAVGLEDDSVRSVAVQSDGKILLGGGTDGDYGVVRLNADGSLDRGFGTLTNGFETVIGTNGNDVIIGSDVRDNISANAGKDLIDGGAGADSISTGSGADVIRYTDISDSYRSHSDLILDFNANQDRIDLAALGFTGFGNGRGGTLAVVENENSERTYLKSYDADADGNRFELTLNGLYEGLLTTSNVLFSALTLNGTASANTLTGTAATEVLNGLKGNDTLNGGFGDDVLVGGAGRDNLTGGSGDDVFRFANVDDSYRTDTTVFSDLITDFVSGTDRLDVSTLGFIGLGDGHDGTLKVQLSGDGSRTYLKSLDATANGHRFEVSLTGNHADLAAADVIFSAPTTDTSVALLGTPVAEHVS